MFPAKEKLKIRETKALERRIWYNSSKRVIPYSIRVSFFFAKRIKNYISLENCIYLLFEIATLKNRKELAAMNAESHKEPPRTGTS